MKIKNIIIIDDDLELSHMFRDHINSVNKYRCELIYHNPIDFVEDKMIDNVDVILLDLAMPKCDGLKGINLILSKYPDVSIVVNSIKDDESVILKAIQEGAVGYIDKPNFHNYFEFVLENVSEEGAFMTPRIAKKLFLFFQKKNKLMHQLTRRERDITQSIIDGNSYKMTAYDMNISLDTVRMHIRNIYRKFQINSKAELINIFKGFDDSPQI